jgi:hypothetical protein
LRLEEKMLAKRYKILKPTASFLKPVHGLVAETV